MYYVYVYLDPRKPGNYNYGEYKFDYEPFYIGKGKYRFDKKSDRKNFHWKSLSWLKDKNGNLILEKAKEKDGNIYKLQLIDKIINLGFDITKYIKVIKEFYDEIESLNFEEFIIKSIGRKCDKTGPLTNLTKGGEFHRFVNVWNKGLTKDKDERIKKLSEDRTGSKNPMFGKKQTKSYYDSREKLKGIHLLKNNEYKYIINGLYETTDFKFFCLNKKLNYQSIMSTFIYFKKNEINYKNWNIKRELRNK